jgi:hypothetical protein
VRNLPETPIIFLVYSPKRYKMSTNTHIWAQTDADERISDLSLQPHKRIHILALTGIWVVTQDFGRMSKQNFGSNPSCSYVRPVVTQGSTVYSFSPFKTICLFPFERSTLFETQRLPGLTANHIPISFSRHSIVIHYRMTVPVFEPGFDLLKP